MPVTYALKNPYENDICGLSGTFQNFASGVLIILLKPFQGWRYRKCTRTRRSCDSNKVVPYRHSHIQNTTVIVPNSQLSNEIIFNLSREGKRRIDSEIKFNYGVDFEKIKNIILSAVNSFDGA